MNKELIINSTSTETTIALLENKKLVELHKDEGVESFLVGNIYIAKVKKIMEGLNAAFVDIGADKKAFLHYNDLGPNFLTLKRFLKDNQKTKSENISTPNFQYESIIDKKGKINEVVALEQEILVIIEKEAIATKGIRVSSEISIPGRYLVLIPFSNNISVSNKITSKSELSRLKKLVNTLKPKNFGFIVRTNAEGKSSEEIEADFKDLKLKWDTLTKNLKHNKAPFCVFSESSILNVLLRDTLNKSFTGVHIDNENLYKQIKSYIGVIAPEFETLIKQYKGKVDILEHFGVAKQMKTSYGKVINTRNRAYIIIERTEAMHVIDVNSGQRTRMEKTQEENAIEVNLEAAEEIARQIRLRDIGGIIIVDFIDMKKRQNRDILFKKLSEYMNADRARHNILPPSSFGLVQITRERVRPEVRIDNLEKCPTCHGTGKISASISIIDNIDIEISNMIVKGVDAKFKLKVHPYIAAYILKGIYSVRTNWFVKHRKWIPVIADENYDFMEYSFVDKNNNIIHY